MSGTNINQEQLDSLMEKNMGLVVSLANSFKPQSRNELDEYIQLGRIGLWKAIKKYDPNRAKLSTAIWNYCTWEILRHLQKEKKHRKQIPLNESLCAAPETSLEIWDYVPDYLSDREYRVISLRLKGHTFAAIGKELGYSRGWANNVFKSAIGKIEDANQDK